jgi:hypothetical protein
MKYIRPLLWALMAFALVLFVPQDVSAKTVSAALSAEKVKVGKQVSVSAKTKNVTYSSSDTTIACVSDEGIVTGKKAGKVTIHVKSEGYDTRSLALTVVKASKKPTTLPVALDEVKLENPAMTQAQDGTWTYSAQVKNEAESGTVKEITRSDQGGEDIGYGILHR